MSFRSKASQINAENYVRIKQEASANVPLRTTSKTTTPNSHSLQFGPFEPKKTSLKTSIPTNDPPNCSMSSNSKSSMPKNYPSHTSMTTTTLKPLINPCAKSSHDVAKRSQVVLPESSNGIGKSSIPSKSTAPTNDLATFKSSTLINPFTKSSNGISKSFMPTTFKSSAVTNDLSINTKPTNPKSFTNASTKSSTFTNACSQMHVDTQVLDEGLQTEEAVEKSCEGKQDPNAKENEIKAPNKTKKVWKPGGKVQWTESIDVDPDEVVEVEEIRENEPPKLGVMEGTLVAKHVWCLPPGRRIIVHFNEYDQPVRKGGLVLVHFLSDLSKDASFCPLGAHTWKHVDDHYKERIIKTVHEKFVLPDRTVICRMLLLFVNLKWKHYKWKLHQAYYNPNMSKEKMIEKKPENVTKEQWINLVSYWCSEKFKTLSSLGKRAREMQDQVRTTGSQSYARGKCDFVSMLYY